MRLLQADCQKLFVVMLLKCTIKLRIDGIHKASNRDIVVCSMDSFEFQSVTLACSMARNHPHGSPQPRTEAELSHKSHLCGPAKNVPQQAMTGEEMVSSV